MVTKGKKGMYGKKEQWMATDGWTNGWHSEHSVCSVTSPSFSEFPFTLTLCSNNGVAPLCLLECPRREIFLTNFLTEGLLCLRKDGDDLGVVLRSWCNVVTCVSIASI